MLTSTELAQRLKVKESWVVDQSKRSRTSDPIPVFRLGKHQRYHTRRANREHTWFVFETKPWRLQKSLSDLNGTDVYVHGGTPAGVFRELLSAFVRHHNQPTVWQMTVIFEALRKSLRPILQETGAASPFEASVTYAGDFPANTNRARFSRRCSNRVATSLT